LGAGSAHALKTTASRHVTDSSVRKQPLALKLQWKLLIESPVASEAGARSFLPLVAGYE